MSGKDLYGRSAPTVSEHIANIFEEELEREIVLKKRLEYLNQNSKMNGVLMHTDNILCGVSTLRIFRRVRRGGASV